MEENESDDDIEDGDDDDDSGLDVDETEEEEVEILVSFEEDGQEYHLVRLLDPVLLVGKVSLVFSLDMFFMHFCWNHSFHFVLRLPLMLYFVLLNTYLILLIGWE